MQTMVSLGMVEVGVFVFLACVCGAIYWGLRSQSSLTWLAAALLGGALGVLIVGEARGSTIEWLALTVLVPASYLCVAQSLRIALDQRGQYRVLIAAVGALTALAMLLVIARVPFLYQTLPFQLACALAVLESVVRLLRAPQRNVLDVGLIVALTGLAAIFLARIPLYLILFAPGSRYAAVRGSPFQGMTLVLTGILALTVAFLLLVRVIGSVIATYRTRSERDVLTGLLNRHGFDLAVAGRGRGGGALILCDIDHFKRVNDRYGHAVGDDVLRAFATLLQLSGHPVGRMGGEEFALLLPRCNAADATEVAEMIRQRFYLGSYPGIAADHQLSASFGIAEFGSAGMSKDAFIRADVALYRAKQAGRNRVVVGSDGDNAVPIDPRLRAA